MTARTKKIIRLTSDLNAISEVETFIEKIASEAGIRKEVYNNIHLAVIETVNNALMHGNRWQSDKLITVTIVIQNTQLTITVEDEGDGFDYNSLPDPTIPENLIKNNGRGIFIMRSLSDKLTFQKNGSKVILKYNI